MNEELYRVIDANLNRLKEGIRVIEDMARYVHNNKELSTQLKTLRHLAKIDDIKPLLASRDAKNDVLRPTMETEMNRSSLESIIIANYKRAQESSRVLEEVYKVVSPELSENFKNLYKDFDKSVIASTTDLNGTITYASSLFCKLSKFSREELLGHSHNLIRHPDMSKEIFKDMWTTIQDGQIWKGEIKNSIKGGGFYWVDAIISPVFDKDGTIIEYNAIRQDITSKKALEDLNKTLENKVDFAVQQTKEKEQHMLNQSKMAQMGEMLSMIAHQWRQPLAAISSTASALELKIILDNYTEDEFTKSVKNIQSYSKHLSSTIDDFRNFFKESKLVNKINFSTLIEETVNIVHTSLNNKNISISIDNQFLNELCIYESELKQVLLNLIKNAEDAILENNISDGAIEIKTYKQEENVILEVNDNGGGIPNEVIAKLFDPYFSTKDKKNGTGLGLYMSKTIVANHFFGEITCSNEGEGASFKISFNPTLFCNKVSQ